MHRLSSVIFLLLILITQTGVHAKNTAPNILILGDSLSAAHNIPVAQSWPQIFSSNIRASFPQTRVINASISGETTFGGLQRLQALVDEHQPSHLIIELGGNDGLRGLNFKQTTENLRQMLKIAEQHSITVLLIGVRLPPNLGPAYNNRFQQIYNTVAEEFPVRYLAEFLLGVAASDAALMQEDGIHPTALAQPLLAQKVLREMEALLTP